VSSNRQTRARHRRLPSRQWPDSAAGGHPAPARTAQRGTFSVNRE
jgi:hypothetical protein